MTIQERITHLESELQTIHQQLAQWNEARLRTEGAIHYLRNMDAEEKEETPAVVD